MQYFFFTLLFFNNTKKAINSVVFFYFFFFIHIKWIVEVFFFFIMKSLKYPVRFKLINIAIRHTGDVPMYNCLIVDSDSRGGGDNTLYLYKKVRSRKKLIFF